jgi:hypothetical protein
VTVYNIGNAGLYLNAQDNNPVYPPSFPINANDQNACEEDNSVNPGSSCDVSANFTPTTPGSLSGFIVLTNNNLNTSATQSIPVSGNGIAVAAPAVSLNPLSLNFGGVQIDNTSPPLIETVTNTGAGTLNISGITITQTGDTVFFIATGANQCTNTTALAAGQSCKVYVTFRPALSGQTSNGTLSIADNAPPSPQTAALTGVGDYFFEPINTSSGSEPVSVFITRAGTLSGINVVTEGSSHLDFGNDSGGTCSAGTVYAVGQVCIVNVEFTPRYSGARNGSVYLTDAGGNVLGSTFLAGWGDGPELVFTPAQPTAITGTIAALNSVAVDGASNLYYVDGSGNVSMLAWTGASYNPATVIVNIFAAIGSQAANCIAIDANGNLYVGANSHLEKIPATGPGTWGTPISLNIPGGDNVFQIGVDGAGNLYFSDPIHEKVDEMTWNGSQYGAPTAVPFAPSNTVTPWGLAVDSTGDVFTLGTVDASGATEVLELPVNGNGYGTVVTVPLPTIAGALYLALDGNNDVYVTGLGVSSTGDVLLVPYANNAFGTPISINPGTSFGYLQLTVDGAGNVYAVNQPTSTQFEDEIVKFSLPDPSALTFNLTNVGSTSSDSPKTVSVTNIGNEDVYFNNISYPGDFPEDGSASQQCNNEFPLVQGATCGVSIDFTPSRDGYITENVKLTDNDLDDANISQSISVTGTGTEVSGPAVTLNPPSLNFEVPTGNTSNVAVSTLTNTGSASLTITKTSLIGANPGTFIETDNCVAKSPIPINGTCSISVSFVSTVVGPFSAAISFVDNAANTPQSLSLTATATLGAPIVTLTPALAFPVTSVGSGAELSATLSNTGNAPLTNIAISVTGANAYNFRISPSGSCFGMKTLPQDSSCIINLDFLPSVPGASAATLSVTDNAVSSPQTSALTGLGTQAELQLTPGQFNFLAGTPGMVGDTASGPAISALIAGGYGIALDSTGLVYFSDYDFNTVYQIDGNGNINVYAGMPVEAPGHGSYSGDNGAAANATLNAPEQIAFDPSGNLYIADRFNNLIRMVNSQGTITTFAGNYGNGFGGYAGDGGPANQATLSSPQGVTADSQGNVYIADTNNNVVRKVDTTGKITLFAGTPGVSGNSGDGGPATSATLGQIYQLATDLNGNLFIADFGNGVVRKVDSNGTITTYAGGGMAAVTTTPQPATSVNLNNGPVSLATDPAGNLYVLGLGHTNSPGVFVVNTNQQISQIVGGGISLVNGAPANAENSNLNAIALDAFGDLYVNDAFDHIVAEIDPNGDLAFPNTPINTVSAPLTVILSNTGNAPLSFTNQNEDDDVVRKQRHPASARARAAAHTARPDVVDFESYGTISGPFAIASGGTCNFDDGIQAGDSCTMNVTFNPTATGAATGTITLYSNQGNNSDSSSTILLSGTGTQALVPGATLTPSQSFPNTITGTTSSVVAATLTNTGNGPLTISGIGIGGANPGEFAVSTGSNACGTTLAAGATCNIYVTFMPASVSGFSATLTVTDNANPTTQSLALSATGIPQMSQAILFTQPASVTYSPNLTVALVATGGASGNPVVFTLDASSTGTGSIAGSTLTVTAVGNFVIDANQAGNATYAAATQVQKAFVVSQAPQAIDFTQPASPIVYSSGLTITLTATGGASGNPVTFTLDESSTATGSITGSTLTVTSAGKLVIDANQAGNTDYSAAPQVQRTVLVNPPPPDFTIAATPASQTIAAGASTTFTVTLSAINGTFNNVITLSASGLPTGATGAFQPATINPGNSKGTSTFTVTLAPVQQASTHGSSWPLATPALALLFLLPFRRWRKAWRGKLLLLVAAIVSLAGVVNLTACGGGFLLGGLSQNYTITITGAGGNDTHSTTVQLTVK